MGALPRATARAGGLDPQAPALPTPGRAAGAGSTAGLAFPVLLGKRCKVSDNAEGGGGVLCR